MSVRSLPESSNPYLSGNLAPVDKEVTAFDLKVTGQIPTELNGRYLRNGQSMNDIDQTRTIGSLVTGWCMAFDCARARQSGIEIAG